MHVTDHRKHIRSLDGLRGLAILLVFCFHYFPRHRGGSPVAIVFGLGWLGVDLFFTLSGFLITGILLDTLPQPGYFRNFYGRRALRLFPAYLCVVAVTLGIGYAHGMRPTIWAFPFLLYGSNIVANLQLPLNLGGYVGLDHLWSLALEEQFYLVWPPLLFLLRRQRRVLLACIVGIAFSVVLRFVLTLHPPQHYLPYNELPTRLDGLLFGAVLAILLRSYSALWERLPSLWLRVGLGVAAVCVAFCVRLAHTTYWSSQPMVRYGYLASSLGSFCLIGLALHPGSWTETLGSNAFLRLLGRYSYGLYLWHLLPNLAFDRFIAFCAGKLPLVGGSLGFLLVFCACFAIAWTSYHLIELPCLRLKRYFAYADEARTRSLVVDQDETEPVTGAA